MIAQITIGSIFDRSWRPGHADLPSTAMICNSPNTALSWKSGERSLVRLGVTGYSPQTAKRSASSPAVA